MAEEKVSATLEASAGKADLHGGHRKRILERLQNGVLCPHEYLEVLLFSALPRRNTNDLAHRLLAEFGDFQGVLQAPVEQLMEVRGVGENLACFLRTVGVIMESVLVDNANAYPRQFSQLEFARFLRREYGPLRYETFDVFALDAWGEIVGRRKCSSMASGKVEVKMPWFIEMLAHYQPAGVILVHNHPFGLPAPSGSDDDTTAECRAICEKNGILLCDHYIYSPQGIYSYNLGRPLTRADLIPIRGGEDDEDGEDAYDYEYDF